MIGSMAEQSSPDGQHIRVVLRASAMQYVEGPQQKLEGKMLEKVLLVQVLNVDAAQTIFAEQ